jgi:Endoribonuclease L-PSP
MMERKNLFPQRLSKRVVGGHVPYSPVVTVVAGKLIFVSGLLARNHNGEIVGKGDMGAQIRQVGENLKAALAAAGATLARTEHLRRRQTRISCFRFERRPGAPAGPAEILSSKKRRMMERKKSVS